MYIIDINHIHSQNNTILWDSSRKTLGLLWNGPAASSGTILSISASTLVSPSAVDCLGCVQSDLNTIRWGSRLVGMRSENASVVSGMERF